MRSLRPTLHWTLAALAAASLSACRGGGPNRSVITVAPTPVMDASFTEGTGIRGVILVGQTYTGGVPLADAVIVLAPVAGTEGREHQARSDAEGRFEVRGIPAGAYSISVTLPRDTSSVTRTVTAALRPVQLSIPGSGGRLDVELLARYLPGSSRLITAVDLISPTS